MSNQDASKKEIIASRIREARKMAGLSQGQVARMLELRRPSISEAEAGRRNVSAEELTKLADSYQKITKDLKKHEQIESIAKEDIKWLRNQIKENLAKISIMKDESSVYR